MNEIPAHVSRRIAEEVSAELGVNVTPEAVDLYLTTGEPTRSIFAIVNTRVRRVTAAIDAKAREYGLAAA